MSKYGHQEVVMFYSADEEIQEELFFDDFERLTQGRGRLEAYAASSLRAAYCVVGGGLNLSGVVFFVVNVLEDGLLDPNFNLPLRYLVKQAGVGGDIGHGGIRTASRGHCAVPWHSLNLWEPRADDPLKIIQQRLYRNKLKLKSVVTGKEDFFGEDAAPDYCDFPLTEHLADQGDAFSNRLTEVFGQAGKLSLQDLIRLHSEQLSEAKLQFRDQVEEQQAAYLEQLREARQEIHDLKVALRQEQSRNRRLQQMLRGDP